MTHEELVARLTAAVDNDGTDGNATAVDEGQAAAILERLLRSYSAPGPGESPPNTYSARYARWAQNIEHTFLAYDRSVRALMTMIQERAPRDGGGNIIDPLIASWDPEVEVEPPPEGVSAISHMGDIRRYGRRHGIAKAVLHAADQAARDDEVASTRPEPQRDVSRFTVIGASDYPAAKAAAEAYVQYLDAVAAPPGVP